MGRVAVVSGLGDPVEHGSRYRRFRGYHLAAPSLFCGDCGVYVADEDVHDAWHGAIDDPSGPPFTHTLTDASGPAMTVVPWCEVDYCPASICNGPHVSHHCPNGDLVTTHIDAAIETPCPFCGWIYQREPVSE